MKKEYIIENIFTDNGIKFLKDNMSICIDDLNQKILSEASSKIMFFKKLIDFIITLKPPYDYLESSHLNNYKNRDFLNDELFKYLKKHNIDEDSNAYFIFDNIRHAYINYCAGGILAIYKGREAEVWYPKIVIHSNIGDRRDIELLGNDIVIYRGASKDEYNSKIFGQSWTLDEKIAKQFAFEHYEGQPDYENTIRVVLKAKINKTDIYYYQKEDRENEVIINSNRLVSNSINILEEAVLE